MIKLKSLKSPIHCEVWQEISDEVFDKLDDNGLYLKILKSIGFRVMQELFRSMDHETKNS